MGHNYQLELLWSWAAQTARGDTLQEGDVGIEDMLLVQAPLKASHLSVGRPVESHCPHILNDLHHMRRTLDFDFSC